MTGGEEKEGSGGVDKGKGRGGRGGEGDECAFARAHLLYKQTHPEALLFATKDSKILWSATNLYLKSELEHSNTIYEPTPACC